MSLASSNPFYCHIFAVGKEWDCALHRGLSRILLRKYYYLPENILVEGGVLEPQPRQVRARRVEQPLLQPSAVQARPGVERRAGVEWHLRCVQPLLRRRGHGQPQEGDKGRFYHRFHHFRVCSFSRGCPHSLPTVPPPPLTYASMQASL